MLTTVDIYMNQKDLQSNSPSGTFTFDENDIKNIQAQKVTIFKGAPYVVNPKTRDNSKQITKEAKEKILKKREDPQYRNCMSNGIFTAECHFDSLSLAAGLILGRSSYAYDDFGIKSDGKFVSLKEAYREHFTDSKKSDNNKTTGVVQNNGEDSITSDESNDFICPVNAKYLSKNIIFYGVPGCGKSHKINELLSWKDGDEIKKMPSQYHKRILFHPEYSYSDFVGQTMPKTRDNGNIEYVFSPGPFVEILCDAYRNKDKQYFLVIEEINRGNAPAIFGDLFQLLDRDNNGESEYGIYNRDILGELKKAGISTEEVRIPRNLTVFATMNTCDQNVFTMDTAFKRRWRMTRIKNDFDDSAFANSDLAKAAVITDKNISWREFGKAVNSAIVSNCNDGSSSEDKQLGTYFIKESEIEDGEAFAEKVIMYLWDDVAKYDKSQLFDTNKYKTLDMAINGFVNGENVFSPNCRELNDLYSNNQ